jgi:SulP family sulfate permease
MSVLANSIKSIITISGNYYFSSIIITDYFPSPTYVEGKSLAGMIGITILVLLIMFLVPMITGMYNILNYYFVYLLDIIPAAFFGIAIALLIEQTTNINTLTVGDKTSLAGAAPTFHIPVVDLTMENVFLIVKYAISLAV